MEAKHTPAPWIQASESLPNEYEDIYVKNADGVVRVARLSKAEGGCWQLATFLVDTKRPGYAWKMSDVVAWRAIQPTTVISNAAPDLLAALIVAEAALNHIRCTNRTVPWDDTGPAVEQARAAIAKAQGESA